MLIILIDLFFSKIKTEIINKILNLSVFKLIILMNIFESFKLTKL